MKDNFDLKGYLIENKMTENSRGDVRHHLTEAVDLDMRVFKGKKLLSEVRIPADPYDHHDPEYDEDYFSGPGADQVDAALDAQKDAGLDECGDMNLGGDIPLEEAGRPKNWTPLSAGHNSYVQYAAPESPEEINSKYSPEDFTAVPYTGEGDEFFNEEVPEGTQSIVFSIDDEIDAAGAEAGMECVDRKALGQALRACKSYDEVENSPIWDDMRIWKQLDQTSPLGLSGMQKGKLEEAGYTDDEDDYASDDLDLDDRGGASLMDLIGKDKGASRARKAAAKDTAEDPAMEDEPVDPEQGADPTDPEEDPEDAAGESDPNAAAEPGLSSQLKYNPNTVQMTMTNEELDQFLSGFRRPQVAVRVLNRALKAAQDEVNDSIGLNHLYLVLENGFYVTSRSQRGDVIAKVSADQEWRKKNFGD